MDVRVAVHLDRAEPAGAQVGDGPELRLAVGRRSSAAAIVDQRRWMHVPGPALDPAAADPKLAPFGVAVVDPTGRIADRQHRIGSGRAGARSPPSPRDRASHSSMDRAGRWRRLRGRPCAARRSRPGRAKPPPACSPAAPGAGSAPSSGAAGTSAGSRPQTSAGSPRSRRRATIGAPSRVAHTASPVTSRAATTTGSSQARRRPDRPTPASGRGPSGRGPDGEHGPERLRGLRAVAARCPSRPTRAGDSDPTSSPRALAGRGGRPPRSGGRFRSFGGTPSDQDQAHRQDERATVPEALDARQAARRSR